MAQQVKNPSANEGDMRGVGLIPGLGRSSRKGNDNPLQYFWSEEPGGLQSMGSQESNLATNAP